jgi:nitrate/TMAO reductase-like tetraheme cytochrome c subunit
MARGAATSTFIRLLVSSAGLLLASARAEAPVPSKDFPLGAATPSAECGTCHRAIYREYAEGLGSDLHPPTIPARGGKPVALAAAPTGGAHAIAGTDPWPAHASEAEESGRRCEVCHFPQPFAIPDSTDAEIPLPVARGDGQREGITCASCHLTPEGVIRGPHAVAAPHATIADERMSSSEMCAPCHALGQRLAGKQTQTYLEWRDDFFAPGLGRQECQDCHMPRTLRKTTEDADVPVRAVARHLWTGGHSPQRVRGALAMGVVQPQQGRPRVEVHVINIGAGHSVPTGSSRRAVHLTARLLDARRRQVAAASWMFAPWYGPRPDDRAHLAEDEKRSDRVAAMQADRQGPHEAPIRAGEERILTWEPDARDGRYTVEATLVYDLNRFDERVTKGGRQEIARSTLPVVFQTSR